MLSAVSVNLLKDPYTLCDDIGYNTELEFGYI